MVLVFYFTTSFSGCLQRRFLNLVEHLHGSFFCESTVKYFRKKSSATDVQLSCLANKGLKYWTYSCFKSINQARKILSRKMCVTSLRVFMEKQPVKVFFKESIVMRNFAEFIIKHLCQISFLIKLNSLDLQLH